MLTDRQLIVLQMIVDDFIETAQPVGSRALAKKEELPYSAATIRNDMADLEETGYLEKTHSSSGRVPSEKGYRYYVDHLVQPIAINQQDGIITNLINEGISELDQIIKMSAEVLSELTSYTSIILGPEIFETKLKQLQIVPLSNNLAVAILVTNTGHVEHHSFTIPDGMNPSELEKMVNIVNEKLQNVPLVNLQSTFYDEIGGILKRYIDDFELAIESLKSIFVADYPVKLYISGKSNILSLPEFNDVEKIRSFYALLDQKEDIVNLLKNSEDGIAVSIGNENAVEAIKDFSLITSSYNLGKNQTGTIALLGPTRMEYRKVISLLKGLSFEIKDVLYDLHKNH